METSIKYVEEYMMHINDEVDTLVYNLEKFQDQRKEMEESCATEFIRTLDGCERKYVNHSTGLSKYMDFKYATGITL